MDLVPERIQRQRTKGWRIPEGAVNVTRSTDWGNPFRVGSTITYAYGDTDRGEYHTLTITRVLAVELFRAWVTERGWLDQIQRELAGKDLVCWCPLPPPGYPDICHAAVLLEIAQSGEA